MPTIFVVPAAFTLNSPGQYSPGTGPTPAGTPSVRSPAASCAPSTANRSRKASARLRVAGDEVEHERALVVRGEPPARGPGHGCESVRPGGLLGRGEARR